MIRTVPELRSLSIDVIKIAQNTDPSKTEGKRLLGLITDILDTVDDLVEKQGLSISANMQQQRTDILNKISNDLSGINDSIASYVANHMPDLSSYLKSTDTIPYTKLTGTPTIPDLTNYQLKSDTISYSRLIGVPSSFDGTWNSLTGKPSFFNGDYNSLLNKPTIPASFSGSYLDLTNKPTIPTYDLSLYRQKSDSIDYSTLINKPTIINDYTQLSNKPTIITDYSQLSNKPNSSKLLWNQLSNANVSNTVTETNVLVTGNGSLNIDANPVIGTSYRISGRGMFSLQTLTSPTLNVKLYVGNTLIASGTSSSLLLGANNKTFSFGVDLIIASTTSVYAQGFFAYYAGLTDALSSTPIITTTNNPVTVDLSIINQLKLTFAWSIANSANMIQTKIVNFEKLNNN